MSKLGIVTYNIANDWDLDTVLGRCQELGLEGVELRTTHAHQVEIDLSTVERAEIKRRFADSPVTLVGLGSICEYHAADPVELRRQIDLSLAFVKLAADVGAQGVKVRPNAFPEGVPREKTIEQIGRALGTVAAFGADHGVAIRLEVHGRETCHPPYIRQMIDYAGHPNARICWNSNPTDRGADGTIDAAFDRLNDRIDLVHMSQLYSDYPYARLFELLQSIDYRGFCLAELPASSDPETVLRYYRRLFQALQPAEA